MPTMQEYLANATLKGPKALLAAVENLPEDKRAWVPAASSRSAIDQVAECAIVTGATAEILVSRIWDEHLSDMEAYNRAKTELAQDWGKMVAMLEEGCAKMAAAIRDVPDADLEVVVQMPWGGQTLAEIMSYPFWNMSYHEGQINYIASILGCLGE